MRVLVFHGYLLRGHGLATSTTPAWSRPSRAWATTCTCSARTGDAGELPWVDSFGGWEDGALTVEEAAGTSPGAGSVTVYVPDIGGLLPVYVTDEYEGFEVKAFEELSGTELDNYIRCERRRREGGCRACRRRATPPWRTTW